MAKKLCIQIHNAALHLCNKIIAAGRNRNAIHPPSWQSIQIELHKQRHGLMKCWHKGPRSSLVNQAFLRILSPTPGRPLFHHRCSRLCVEGQNSCWQCYRPVRSQQYFQSPETPFFIDSHSKSWCYGTLSRLDWPFIIYSRYTPVNPLTGIGFRLMPWKIGSIEPEDSSSGSMPLPFQGKHRHPCQKLHMAY